MTRQIDTAHAITRCSVPALDTILGHAFPVLDYGHVRAIDYMGNDAAIVQAARVSYGKGTKTLNEDEALIRYLIRNKHTTPLEMCSIKFHIKLPIFIARQWIRHRTAKVNEYSGRYSEMEADMYEPDLHRMTGQHSTNKQGSGDEMVENVMDCYRGIITANTFAREAYKDLLDEGLNRETARTVLNLNQYTQWYWKIDLHNLLHFLALRADFHAQWEIQQYANAMLEIVKVWCPMTYQAFIDYRKDAMNLSAQGINVLQRLIAGEQVTQETSGMGKREYEELMDVFGA